MARFVGFVLGAGMGAGLTGLGAVALFFAKGGTQQALWGVLLATMLGFGAGGNAGVSGVTLFEAWRAGSGVQGGGAVQGMVRAGHGMRLAVLGFRVFVGLGVVFGVLVAELALAVGL